ncbi:MAG TPA: SPFH domain-containing protein [Terriglobales bacterium]|nr:SPFH domain-containing protein [Terriglobales bacterium]
MLFLRFLLLVVSFGFLAGAAGTVIYDIYLAFELNRILRRNDRPSKGEGSAAESAAHSSTLSALPLASASSQLRDSVPRPAVRWTLALKLVALAAITSFAGKSLVVVPDGEAGVRVSQISGVRPGTLYPGTHLIFPLTERVVLYDVRDKVFSTAAVASPKEKLEVLNIEAREGLSVGLAVTVRYRLDPTRLSYVQANLPQPIDELIVEPVVASTFRDLGPNYIVRDLFSTKRGEFREKATQAITARLGDDAIIVKEVLLRKVELPEEYARGLQGLLEKEQEDDRTLVDASIEQKKVKIAESQAEAAKVRQIKHAEADAQSRVLMAKAESDSMQYTLPLKQKQIEQSRLEAEARKEATIQNAEAEATAQVKTAEAAGQSKVIASHAEAERNKVLAETQNILVVKNAEAAAQAKIIDSKAEQENRNLLADAGAHNIRVTSQAEAEQLQLEAAALKTNPLLVQYTVAQRLSDRVQIMMVPTDGKFFFTNDVLKSVSAVTDSPLKLGAK